MTANIADNITSIKEKIAQIHPGAQLIAVSKNHSADNVRQAIKAGQKLFGENRVQEAAGKFVGLKNEFPDIKLHLIGPLQTNKVKEALKLFDVIQTIDREKLANEVAKELTKSNEEIVSRETKKKQFFIQVNIGEEPQKAGIMPQATEKFFTYCNRDLKLDISGLMCIPPVDEPAFMYFALLRNIAASLKTEKPFKLSMGMSGDYEQALKMGADYIRLGTAIFGDRANLKAAPQ